VLIDKEDIIDIANFDKGMADILTKEWLITVWQRTVFTLSYMLVDHRK